MSFVISKQHKSFLYEQVIALIDDMVCQGMICPGDKLPSLRAMAGKLNVSIPTVKQAYQVLEAQGKVRAQEKSGYFLQAVNASNPMPKRVKLPSQPIVVNKQQLIEQVYDAIHQPSIMPFGIANPVMVASTDKILAKLMRRAMHSMGENMLSYGAMDGLDQLKKQIVHRYLDLGLVVNTEELVITNGAQEALAIALQCVTEVGDVVAIESPCYFGIVELVESLGLKVIEIPVCPDDGVWLCDLGEALLKHDIKACVFSTSINNPLGSFMPDIRRKALVELLEYHQVTLIEDDVYGDLHFTERRGKPAQCYTSTGNVITCASFSKTAAPSYRVGWMVAGPHSAKARRLKRAFSCSGSLMNQLVLADYLISGEYDRHLKLMRKRLMFNKTQMVTALRRYFPSSVRLSDPQGGCVIWVDLGTEYSGSKLFQLAIAHRISITPGVLFSAGTQYESCIRMSYGLVWNNEVEQAIALLGQLLFNAKK
ncbi:PLP-dependent aminotransferase family protein [Pseudoalteromonas citrea]|uniref:PLP-dependent aminotransferase family protein n=1 Tax=Pseudoalteromonas citrea TaxID=43655 RepID=A0A5S3XMA7_9GAMM|nr:PLP-dependent aminotransferase family protein [Pseudoalteromonas citrea]TMP43756.1 PLP-dependent aminotransferase family protein [Pseudoalteromonas citrea]TMP55307.1 PLP-dependent aminotransferase family protein [Pseudoalteromonas citrea]